MWILFIKYFFMSEIKIDLKKLIKGNIIDEKIAKNIEIWYQKELKENRGGRFMMIFMTIGAIAIGLGLILLIASNWSNFTSFVKTVFIITITLLFYGVWYYFAYKKEWFKKIGHSLIFLWSISYGVAIFLLGQIYNVGGNYSSALLLWMIWIIPLAFYTRYISIFSLSLVLLYAFIFSYVWENYTFSGFVITLLFIVISFFNLVLVRYYEQFDYKQFWLVSSTFWIIWLLWWIFAFTFKDFWIYGLQWDININILVILLLFLVLWILWVSISSIQKKKIELDLDFPFFIWSIIILALIFYTYYHTTIQYNTLAFEQNQIFLNFWGYFYVVGMNLVYLAIVWVFVFLWIKKEKAGYINLSMIFFAIYLIGRYFAFLENSKMEWAIVFITWGVVCLGVGWLSESIRRRVLKNINQ